MAFTKEIAKAISLIGIFLVIALPLFFVIVCPFIYTLDWWASGDAKIKITFREALLMGSWAAIRGTFIFGFMVVAGGFIFWFLCLIPFMGLYVWAHDKDKHTLFDSIFDKLFEWLD